MIAPDSPSAASPTAWSTPTQVTARHAAQARTTPPPLALLPVFPTTPTSRTTAPTATSMLMTSPAELHFGLVLLPRSPITLSPSALERSLFTY